MKILTAIAILWTGMLAAQTIDGDVYTAELTNIAEEANLPGAYKGKVALAFANYHNSAVQQYTGEVMKINALTNRVADEFSIKFTLNGSTMESAQFPAHEVEAKSEADEGSKSDVRQADGVALEGADEHNSVGAMDSVINHENTSQSTTYEQNGMELVAMDSTYNNMPRFPGCEHLRGTDQNKYDCAQREFLTFVYANQEYPEEASNKGIQGTIRVQFTVSPKGSIIGAQVNSSLGYGIDEEALRIVELMNHMEEKWKPGYQFGKPVAVNLILPIQFKLQ